MFLWWLEYFCTVSGNSFWTLLLHEPQASNGINQLLFVLLNQLVISSLSNFLSFVAVPKRRSAFPQGDTGRSFQLASPTPTRPLLVRACASIICVIFYLKEMLQGLTMGLQYVTLRILAVCLVHNGARLLCDVHLSFKPWISLVPSLHGFPHCFLGTLRNTLRNNMKHCS